MSMKSSVLSTNNAGPPPLITIKREGAQTKQQQLTNIDEIRKSIIVRESKNNSCLNQGCLQTECCLLEANRTIQALR
jgi:hypothetical protein